MARKIISSTEFWLPVYSPVRILLFKSAPVPLVPYIAMETVEKATGVDFIAESIEPRLCLKLART